MALDPRKRQKKLEKRKSKQKEKKKALARQKTDDVGTQLRRAGSAPVVHACVNRNYEEEGMANVLLSRELPDGRVAYAMFLVDVYCLGAKNALYGVAVRTRYDHEVFGKFSQNFDVLNLTPVCARKLVEGAVEYAEDLGLYPHADYARARLIFGDIDPGECDREFNYGKDGKPLFVAGPHDSPEKCRRILATLEERCGADGFHYVIPQPGGLAPGFEMLPLEEDEFDADDGDDAT